MYVLINFLFATSSTVVQSLKAGDCCIPTSSKWAQWDICHGSEHSRSTWWGQTVLGAEQKESRRQPLPGCFYLFWGDKISKNKAVSFSLVFMAKSQLSLCRFGGLVLHTFKDLLIRINLKSLKSNFKASYIFQNTCFFFSFFFWLCFFFFFLFEIIC